MTAQTASQRPRLVLIHGWAQHAGIWQVWRDRLAPIADVTAVDLPGHGGKPWKKAIRSLDALADSVLPALEQPAALGGWSLGGIVAPIAVAFALGLGVDPWLEALVAALVLFLGSMVLACAPPLISSALVPHGFPIFYHLNALSAA